VKDLTNLLDVQIEALMKSAKGNERTWCEDELRNRQLSRTLPFDARNEVSADARYVAGHIVTHLWIIGVVVPVVAGLLFVLFTMK
jgi:hypothetical protein